MNPLVSIIIAAYNAGPYLRRCLDAINGQDYRPIELIVVNDGSNDDTAEILNSYKQRFAQSKIQYKVLHQQNKGVASAFKHALANVNGEYLYWQDADDWMNPNAIQALASYLNRHPECNLVRGAVSIVQDGKDPIVISTKKKAIRNIFNDYIFEKDTYCFTGVIMARLNNIKRHIDSRGIFETRAGQNWQLILPASYESLCGHITKPVINYYVHQDSHSHRVTQRAKKIRRCDQHKKIITETIDRIPQMPTTKKRLYRLQISIKYLLRKIKITIKDHI